MSKQNDLNSRNAKEELKKLTNKDSGCVDFTSMIFNYGRFHSNPINKLIHVFGIPLILVTLHVLMLHLTHSEIVSGWIDQLPLPDETPLAWLCADKYGLTYLLLLYLPVTLVYLISDIRIGLVWVALTVPAMVMVTEWYVRGKDDNHFGMSQLGFVGLLQAVGWISQFIGHGVFEKRAPALITNLAFATLAPFFELFLIMNMLFGYKEGPRLKKIYELINQEITEHHA